MEARRERTLIVGLLVPAIVAIVAMPGKTQTVLTDAQAGKAAEMLLGSKPDHVNSYFSKEKNSQYFAFTIRTSSKWDAATHTQLPARERIWIYERSAGSNAMRLVWETHQLWPDFFPKEYELPDGFVRPPGEAGPCLRFNDYVSGNAAGTTRLGLYCIAENHLFWVDYFSEFTSSQTGLERVQVIASSNAAEPAIRYLISWGHELHVDAPPGPPSIPELRQDWNDAEEVRRVQQGWLDTNGRMPCSYQQSSPFSWKGWKTDQIDKLTPYATRRLLKNPEVVLNDERYEWLSYPGAHATADVGTALAGVGRYDKQLGRLELVYVPDSSFDYSKELVVLGDWLYIQDCGGRWAVRFNTVTNRLQRGDFAAVVGELKTGIYPQGRSPHTGTAQTAMFWTDHREKTFRPGRFSPAVDEFILTMMQTLPMEAKGVRCDFGQHFGQQTGGCVSDSGAAINLIATREGTQELEVIGASLPPQSEGPFENLAQIALLYVNRPAWRDHLVPGVARLKVKFSSEGQGLGFSMLTHYGEGYEVDLAVMDKETFTDIGATMGIMGDLGETWEQTWMQKIKLLPNCNFWSLSIIPEGQ
jgi:hypothetical protein